jgi:hypothetical protein
VNVFRTGWRGIEPCARPKQEKIRGRSAEERTSLVTERRDGMEAVDTSRAC